MIYEYMSSDVEEGEEYQDYQDVSVEVVIGGMGSDSWQAMDGMPKQNKTKPTFIQ